MSEEKARESAEEDPPLDPSSSNLYSFQELSDKYIHQKAYNEQLLQVLKDHGLSPPPSTVPYDSSIPSQQNNDGSQKNFSASTHNNTSMSSTLPIRTTAGSSNAHYRPVSVSPLVIGILKDTSDSDVISILERVSSIIHPKLVPVTYINLGFSADIAQSRIPTVGTELRRLFCGPGKRRKIDILKGLTGRLLPGRMTLILGPPGCGKSVFLKALSGREHHKNLQMEGDIFYAGDNIKSGKFRVAKVCDYIEQNDTHAAVLTVEETLLFAWLSSTAGHHAYGLGVSDPTILQEDDKTLSRLENVIVATGLQDCRRTYVGDAVIRGTSGGEKRRVTLAEFMVCPRPVKLLDSVSNGLDAATALDVIRVVKHLCKILKLTIATALLQPSPEILEHFDEIILMSEGQIIYHGKLNEICTLI